MRIAQVSPLHESCPPQLYGGTERVVSYLTEELVRQSRTASRSSMQGSAPASLGDAEPRCAERRILRHHPFSCGFSAFSIGCPALGQDRDDGPWPPRSAGPASPLSRISDDAA